MAFDSKDKRLAGISRGLGPGLVWPNTGDFSTLGTRLIILNAYPYAIEAVDAIDTVSFTLYINQSKSKDLYICQTKDFDLEG